MGPLTHHHHPHPNHPQGGNAASAGRALLTAEQLLQEEGRLSEEWTDVWQLPWRRWGQGRSRGWLGGGATEGACLLGRFVWGWRH